MNLVDALAEQVPNQVAMIDGKRAVSFGELWERVQAGAALFKEAGLVKGDSVLVLQPVSIELYEILLSAFHAGLVVTLIDPSQGSSFVKECLDWRPPDAFVGTRKAQLLRLKYARLRGRSFHTGGWMPFSRRWGNRDRARRLREGDGSCLQVEADHPALITFTSGSTGKPKGVVRSHGFLLAQDGILSRSLNLKQGQVDLVTLPVFALSNLAHGVTSVIADTDLSKPGRPAVSKILEQVERDGISRCTASPAFCEKMPDPFFEALDEVYTGGGPVFSDLVRRAPEKVFAVYGSSEAEPMAHATVEDYNLERISRGEGLPAGRLVEGLRLKICEDEILVTGDHVLKGYLDGRGDGETKVLMEGEVWHRTGDAGRVDGEGGLWLLGRYQAGWRGVYPLQVEAAARVKYPGLRCAFWQGRLFVEEPIELELAWLPDLEIEVMGEIPMDLRHNAKVDYGRLEAIAKKNAASGRDCV